LTGGSPNWAAALSVIILLVTFIGPGILIWILLRAELASAYQWLQTNTAAKNGWPIAISAVIEKVAGWIGVHIGVDPDTIRAAALARINEAGNFFVQKTAAVLGGIGSAVFSLIIILFTLFFMLRAGSSLVRRIALLLPLDTDEIDVLLQKIVASIQGNVLGVIAVGGAQGLLLGLGFWMFGIPSPVLWGLVTGVCSVVPFGRRSRLGSGQYLSDGVALYLEGDPAYGLGRRRGFSFR
jgi:predicted PurR-regulated permease PerM